MIYQLNNLKKFFEESNDIKNLEKISRLISIANQELPPGPITMNNDSYYTYKYVPSGQGIPEMGGGNYFEVVTDKEADQYQRVGFIMGPAGTYDPQTRQKTSDILGWQRLINSGKGLGMDQAVKANQQSLQATESTQQQTAGGSKSTSQGKGMEERLEFAKNYRPPQNAQAIMSIIRQEFQSAGYPYMAGAAIANAAAESNFNAKIRSQYKDKKDPSKLEDSVGLFQLNSRGAGRGMTSEQRQDPNLNTKRIIQEMKSRWNQKGRHTYPPGYKDSSGKDRSGQKIDSLADAVARKATPAELAGLFGYHVERPADQVGALLYRSQLARTILGSEADTPISV